jgi:hypothetical protein
MLNFILGLLVGLIVCNIKKTQEILIKIINFIKNIKKEE